MREAIAVAREALVEVAIELALGIQHPPLGVEQPEAHLTARADLHQAELSPAKVVQAVAGIAEQKRLQDLEHAVVEAMEVADDLLAQLVCVANASPVSPTPANERSPMAWPTSWRAWFWK